MEASPCMRFHAATVGENYLAVSVTCSDVVDVPTMFFDVEGAQRLKVLVQDFSAGTLRTTDEAKYN